MRIGSSDRASEGYIYNRHNTPFYASNQRRILFQSVVFISKILLANGVISSSQYFKYRKILRQ